MSVSKTSASDSSGAHQISDAQEAEKEAEKIENNPDSPEAKAAKQDEKAAAAQAQAAEDASKNNDNVGSNRIDEILSTAETGKSNPDENKWDLEALTATDSRLDNAADRVASNPFVTKESQPTDGTSSTGAATMQAASANKNLKMFSTEKNDTSLA